MSVNNKRRVYPVYAQPPIEVVVHKHPQGYSGYETKVTQIAESKFAQAWDDFAQDISTTFLSLPVTVHDIEANPKPTSTKVRPVPHDNLSLAEMGLSGYRGKGTHKKHTSSKIVPDPLPAQLSMV